MQQFMIPCDFGGQKAPFPIYVGEPDPGAHPLEQQAAWLLRERGGVIPVEVMDAFAKLHQIALENDVSFEEICVYAMGEALDESAPADVEVDPEASSEVAEPLVDVSDDPDEPAEPVDDLGSVPAPPPPPGPRPSVPPAPPGPGHPSWNEEWDAWLWWDSGSQRWFRLVEGDWMPL